MDCSMSGFPDHYQLLKLAQTHVHRVSGAIQPSQPLSPPSPPALNLSQHQGLFQWVGSSHQVAKISEASASSSILPVNIQGWFSLGLTRLISLQSKGLSRVFSSTRLRRHRFFSAQLSLWSNSHPYMTTRKTIALTIWTFVGKVKHYLSTNITGNMKAYASSKL